MQETVELKIQYEGTYASQQYIISFLKKYIVQRFSLTLIG